MITRMQDIIDKYDIKISGVIHIGAHQGQEVLDYVNCGIKDMILFEPLRSNFSILENNISGVDANIKMHQVALGNEEKKVSMYISNNDQLSSSILKPKKHLELHPYVLFVGTEEVEMKRLDSFCEETQSFNFINMDVQGYELEVLKGGTKTLEHIDCVYCEVNRDEVYENNVLIEDLDEFLSQYDMERVDTAWWDGNGDWGDALYIKKQ